MQGSKALSVGDKWRVRGFVYRGEAPEDPQMAAAVVALAERYESQRTLRLARGMAVAMMVLMVPATIYAIVSGQALEAALWGFFALGNAAHLRFNPATQPKNVARSLEASRRIITPND
jgi:hypothetical protein